MAFAKLPTEILIEIFDNLDYCTIQSSIKRVCRTFNYAASACNVKLPGGLEPKLWATIFSHLDYFDLKVEITLTCKPFAHIIKYFDNPGLAGMMFREKISENSSPITANTTVACHPVFSRLSHFCEIDIDQIELWTAENFFKITELDAANENGTFPPCHTIILRFGAVPHLQTISTRDHEEPRAITVLEVIQATCDAMVTTFSLMFPITYPSPFTPPSWSAFYFKSSSNQKPPNPRVIFNSNPAF